MRRFLVLVAVCLMFGSVAGAQDFHMGLNVGLAIPTGDLGDVLDNGFALDIFTEYFTTDNVALRVDGGYMAMDYDYGDLSSFYDDQLSIYHLNGGLSLHLMDREAIHPYLTAGVGAYWWEDDYDDNVEFGVDFGGGISIPMGSLAVDVEGLGHWINFEDDAETIFTISAGVSF